MSEEDKTNLVSLQYWFRVVDLNGDGIITPAEMQHFYTEQMQRMADLNMEVVPFRDVLAQMSVCLIGCKIRQQLSLGVLLIDGLIDLCALMTSPGLICCSQSSRMGSVLLTSSIHLVFASQVRCSLRCR